jgi:hypothetical protein
VFIPSKSVTDSGDHFEIIIAVRYILNHQLQLVVGLIAGDNFTDQIQLNACGIYLTTAPLFTCFYLHQKVNVTVKKKG